MSSHVTNTAGLGVSWSRKKRSRISWWSRNAETFWYWCNCDNRSLWGGRCRWGNTERSWQRGGLRYSRWQFQTFVRLFRVNNSFTIAIVQSLFKITVASIQKSIIN